MNDKLTGSALDALLASARYTGPGVGWDEVIGLSHARREVAGALAVFREPELAERVGAKRTNLLFLGDPGVGKTHLARAVAFELSVGASEPVPLYSFSGAELAEPGLIRAIFGRLRDQRCVVFIDEIDAVADRHSSSEKVKAATVELCVQLDGLASLAGPLVIGATASGRWLLDPSLLRRMTTQVELELPDHGERADLFRLYLGRVIVLDELDLDDLAARSQAMTGSSISSGIQAALGLSLADGRAGLGRAQLLETIQRRGVSDNKPKPDARTAWTIAVHEAGHTAAAWLLFPEAVNRVTVERTPGMGDGHSSLRAEWAEQYVANELDWRSTVEILYAGMVAEELVIGWRVAGSDSDVAAATARLRRFHASGFHAIGLASPAAIEESAERSPRGSEAMRGEQWALIRADAADCYAKARVLLEPHAEGMRAFALRLLDAKSLSGEALTTALEDCLGPGGNGGPLPAIPALGSGAPVALPREAVAAGRLAPG